MAKDTGIRCSLCGRDKKESKILIDKILEKEPNFLPALIKKAEILYITYEKIIRISKITNERFIIIRRGSQNKRNAYLIKLIESLH